MGGTCGWELKLLSAVQKKERKILLDILMSPYKRDFVTLNKAVINYLPRCSYHLLYFVRFSNQQMRKKNFLDGWVVLEMNNLWSWNYKKPGMSLIIKYEVRKINVWLPDSRFIGNIDLNKLGKKEIALLIHGFLTAFNNSKLFAVYLQW